MIRKTIVAAAALLATTVMASAADLAVKARPVMPVEVWNWTGFYIGVHAGAGWGETESTLTGFGGGPGFAFPFSQNSRSGFLGGGQIGANWQAGWAVFGVQADIAGMDVKGTTPCGAGVFSCRSESNWLATVSGRLGAVVLDRGLVYAKGGVAWMNTDHNVDFNLAPPAVNVTNHNSTTFGWLIGLGTEWMITRNWTAFIEYNYIGFDKKNEVFTLNPAFAPPGATVNADIRNTLSVAKVGVNYKFDWGTPVVAKY
jgi:outer membrane immunogenic protein